MMENYPFFVLTIAENMSVRLCQKLCLLFTNSFSSAYLYVANNAGIQRYSQI